MVDLACKLEPMDCLIMIIKARTLNLLCILGVGKSLTNFLNLWFYTGESEFWIGMFRLHCLSMCEMHWIVAREKDSLKEPVESTISQI